MLWTSRDRRRYREFGSTKGTGMRRFASRSCFLTIFFAASAVSFAQSDYKVVPVINGGTISGTVKWSGPVPHALTFPITKDPHICDPESTKTTDLERLLVGPQGGVANTVVYLKNISSGKAWTFLSSAATSTRSAAITFHTFCLCHKMAL